MIKALCNSAPGRFYGRLGMLALAASLLLLFPVALQAQPQDGFRIDTQVFVQNGKKPIADTLTIFTQGRVYDFVLDETGALSEVTLYDPTRGTITLLDVPNQRKTIIKTQDLLEQVFALEQHAVKDASDMFAEAARPKFEVTSEQEGSDLDEVTKIKLAGKYITYTATGKKPARQDASREYRNFADWYSRLNSLRPGNLPAGARIELNKQLATADLIPTEITRVTKEGALSRTLEVRSHHLVNWSLSGEDQKRLSRAGDYLTQFKAVPFDEYRQPVAAKPAKKETAKR